jgi:hypothetical protein
MNQQWNNFTSFQFVFLFDEMLTVILKIPHMVYWEQHHLMVNSNIEFSPMVKSINVHLHHHSNKLQHMYVIFKVYRKNNVPS